MGISSICRYLVVNRSIGQLRLSLMIVLDEKLRDRQIYNNSTWKVYLKYFWSKVADQQTDITRATALALLMMKKIKRKKDKEIKSLQVCSFQVHNFFVVSCNIFFLMWNQVWNFLALMPAPQTVSYFICWSEALWTAVLRHRCYRSLYHTVAH